MKKKLGLLILFMGMLFFPAKAFALNQVNIYFFHWEECSHCHAEEAFLKEIETTYSNVKIYRYEITQETNKEWMKKAKELFNVSGTGVPFTVIGDQSFYGFSNTKKIEMEDAIREYAKENYENQLQSILNTPYSKNLPGELPERVTTKSTPTPSQEPTPSETQKPVEEKYQRNSTILVVGMAVMGIVLVGGLVISITGYRNRKLKK